MKKAALPGTAIVRALREFGLTNKGPAKDFAVRGLYIRGERDHTFVVFYNRHVMAIVLENAHAIEKRAAELGWSFRVRTTTSTYDSTLHNQRVINTRVALDNH